MVDTRPGALDPEMAAQSALLSVLERIKAHREERLLDRNDLPRLTSFQIREQDKGPMEKRACRKTWPRDGQVCRRRADSCGSRG